MTPQQTRAVDPDRLAWGAWSHEKDRQIGEGDISASYSADRIGMNQPVRSPFTFEGGKWVCTGKHGDHKAECYRLVHPSRFPGIASSYAERTRNGDHARRDPNGFYHGMTVKHAGQELVLCGPEVTFIKGEKQQLSLF